MHRDESSVTTREWHRHLQCEQTAGRNRSEYQKLSRTSQLSVETPISLPLTTDPLLFVPGEFLKWFRNKADRINAGLTDLQRFTNPRHMTFMSVESNGRPRERIPQRIQE